MDLQFSAEHADFRADVAAWIAGAMPPELRVKAEAGAPYTHDEVMRWHRILAERGWAAPHWPEEVNGTGWDPAQRFIFSEELELAGAPLLSPFGLSMVGPLIIQFGTDEQKKRFLPEILAGTKIWCQGYSEPNAGSDLASLRCEAVVNDDGDFVVTGQKTWTTHAQYADWIFCLVRTDSSGKKQEGISFLLIDMNTPGVEARPMLTIGGDDAFCETFFENVVVPQENLVGPLHGGWTLAKALLGHERTLIAQVGFSARMIRRLKKIASEIEAPTGNGSGRLIDDPSVRERIARLEIKLRALQMANYRALAGAQLGKAPGPESSILKLRGSEILQDAFSLAMDIAGLDSLTWFNEPGLVAAMTAHIPHAFAYLRATTIYGGSNEIQKNIIAKYILGLPVSK
jgi:alkylation response protein AidB-like acyl-CoA dehydrogenase